VPSLFVIQGRDQGTRFELAPGEDQQSLGRDAGNFIQIHDTEVSRRHAEIRRVDGKYYLVDLGSSNGTYVNAERVHERALTSGDTLQIGRTTLLYTEPSEGAENLGEKINIVGQNHSDRSRILRSMKPEEGSEIFTLGVERTQSPWLARARSNLQIMYRTALAVSHTLDIDQLLSRIMELIFEWVEADRGCIMLVDPEGKDLRPKVRRNRKGVKSDEKITISQTILDYVMQRKEGVLTSNASEDDRWDTGASILQMGIREAICVPMQGRYDMVGVIYIDTYTPAQRFVQPTANKFTDEHLKLMVAIGHQAALAVEDTSYYSAMVQAERLAAVGQTIATLSHHIKNILQGIRGGSYLIEMGLSDHDENVVRKGWDIVERNQKKISTLVMDMLTFSKEREPEVGPASLNDVVRDVIELMQSRADELKVSLAWQPAAELPELIFDSEGIHRAVLNVVTNAIDACEAIENSRVVVSVSLDSTGGHATVTVEDNGPGIPDEDRQEIFSLFMSRKGSRGTGLGLPVSKKILKEHGGDILLDSEIGRGSRFTLQLPAIYPDAMKETGVGR